ncbi:MAG: xanthine dehydrogenase family protein molybdopterin-binding subunit [Coriobacteriales bacterium]|jgi:CO/xanthine dehydrogenase Mo-binding subunit|nr:xanthine dehydrogenase family protein molybdopterin-binding subunit [Coriobacteriales bacterium]
MGQAASRTASHISQSVVKKDHAEKMGGTALYVGDYPQQDMLHGALVRSPHPHARIQDIRYPELPAGYFTVDASDVPGENIAHVVLDDSLVFADGEVFFVGDVIAMIVGPDRREAYRLARATDVVYELLPAVLTVADAQEFFFDYRYGSGDVQAAFAEADHVYEEEFETGYQEQAYLEPQGFIACFAQDGVLTLHGSLQCPYYVKAAVMKATGLGSKAVRIQQDHTGGGFGGKEAFPSILGCQVAIAAMKAAGRPVRVVFDRREDMEFTSKRHPSKSRYRAAVRDGRVTALDIDVQFDSGAFTTLSPVVLQRGIIAAPGVYRVPNLAVRGRGARTNKVPTGAFRGFGAPQTFFAIELMMEHIARDLGLEPLDFKRAQLVERGDATTTGGRYHFDVPLPQMLADVLVASDYERKRARYAEEARVRAKGACERSEEARARFRRGIGLALWFHGAGFTGSGERDIIKGRARIHKSAAGQVEVLVSQSDIGQGIKTTLAKIVACELGLPYEEIIISNPDTARVPDSGPTVASRSLMIVGELLRRAAVRLREEWREGQEQDVEEHFVEPDFLVPFDLETFSGDAYPTYAWGAAVVELQIDSLTGTNEVLGCWASLDVGTPIDQAIVLGQMEGGVLQGLGYASMEQMAADASGRIRNNSYSDYLIPSAVDVPELKVQMHVTKYPNGPYGAAGAGEVPLVGLPPAYLAAAEQALDGVRLSHIPLTAEETLKVIVR